jgi:hypothetical protein
VMERRVEWARDLLKDEDWPIGDIACAAGFSSQSHFTANVRRVTGVGSADRFLEAVAGGLFNDQRAGGSPSRSSTVAAGWQRPSSLAEGESS